MMFSHWSRIAYNIGCNIQPPVTKEECVSLDSLVSKSFEKSLLHQKPPFTTSVLLQSPVVCMKHNWLSANTCLKLEKVSLPQGFKRHSTSAVLADVSSELSGC